MEFLTTSPSDTLKTAANTDSVRKRNRRVVARVVPAGLSIALWLSLLVISGGFQARAQNNALEYQVKAAFLLNFTKFVEWPETAFNAPDAPVTICVVGEDPFGDILDRTIEGETVNGRRLHALRVLPDEDEVGSCHILFISQSERERFLQIVSRLSGSSTLTVSELPGFSDEGGMIEFIVEEGKARFYINAAATEAAGLELSSRLLRVAKEIKRS